MSTIVYPYLAKVEDKKITGWQGGFDNTDDFFQYGLKRPNTIFGEVAEKTQPSKYMKGNYLYCGVLFPYFGHFILESLSRLPYINSEDSLVFSNLGRGDLLEWQRDILEYIGIANRVIVVNDDPIEFESLISLPQSSIINSYIGSDLVKYTSSFRDKENIKVDNPTKLYISRSKIKNANTVQETSLESFFRLNGFKIFHPEEYTFGEQVEVYSRSDTVVSIEGSALHSLIFTKQEINLYVIPRRKMLAHNFMLQFHQQPNINIKVLAEHSGNAANFSSSPCLDITSLIKYFESELDAINL